MKSMYQIIEEILKIKESTLPKSIKANGLGGTLEDMANYLDSVDSRLSQIPASSGQNVKKITVRDLTSLIDVNPDDLYLVFSSGNDTDGWSEKNTFTLYNETYQDGTYFQWINNKWTAVSRDEVNIENVAKFEPLQNDVALMSETFPLSSYWNLEGAEQGGLRIATVDCYELDESSKSYKPKTQSANGKTTNRKTIFVPYAKKYQQGGEDKFEGGLLTATDYKWLSGVLEEVEELASKLPKFSIEVVTELPTENISDTTVYLIPSSSSTSGNLYDEYIYVNKKWELLGSQSVDLSGYAKKSDIPTVPTKVSAFENDADYAKKSELPSTAGLLTEAKAADTYQPKGNYLTEHQSLAEYAKKSEIPTVPTKVSAFENDAEYLTEHQDISGKLNVSGSNGTSAGVSALINKLSSATSTPKDEDYYVCQYAGGGTTTTTYYRRSMAALWKWIKAKTDAEYKPTQWTPFNAASGAASGALVIIGTITHTPSSNKSWQVSIRMLGKHGGTYYGDTTVRLSGVDSATQVNIKEISYVSGSISVPSVRAYRVSDTEIAIGVSKSNSWTGMDCILENINGTDFVTSTAEETKSYNTSYLLTCNSMPWNQNTKSMKVVYEDGTEETFRILIKG